MEFFAKIVKSHNYFSNTLHARSFTGFLTHLSFNNPLSIPRLFHFETVVSSSFQCRIHVLCLQGSTTVINLQTGFALCIVSSLFRTLSIIVNSDIFRHIQVLFRHIQPCCDIFRTLYNSCIFRNLSYSESWHIQNLSYIQNSIKAYSGIFRMLCNARTLRMLSYSELWHVLNPRHFHVIQAY